MSTANLLILDIWINILDILARRWRPAPPLDLLLPGDSGSAPCSGAASPFPRHSRSGRGCSGMAEAADADFSILRKSEIPQLLQQTRPTFLTELVTDMEEEGEEEEVKDGNSEHVESISSPMEKRKHFAEQVDFKRTLVEEDSFPIVVDETKIKKISSGKYLDFFALCAVICYLIEITRTMF